MGVAYGLLVWWGPQVGKPLGEYASVDGAVQAAAFGLVVGLLYTYSTTAPGGRASALAAGEQSG